MNRDYLISKIAEQLKGQQIERGYNFQIEWQIKDKLRPLFEETDFKNISVEKVNRENLLYIRYKNRYLFGLRYTKIKGETHWRTFEDYTEYFYKDFSCADQEADFDLKRKMYEIEIALIDNEEAKQKEFAEMLNAYNQIKALFGDRTSNVIYYINKHKYSLDKGVLE